MLWRSLFSREEGLFSSLPSFDELEVVLFRETTFSTSLPLKWCLRLLDPLDFVVCVCVCDSVSVCVCVNVYHTTQMTNILIDKAFIQCHVHTCPGTIKVTPYRTNTGYASMYITLASISNVIIILSPGSMTPYI